MDNRTAPLDPDDHEQPPNFAPESQHSPSPSHSAPAPRSPPRAARLTILDINGVLCTKVKKKERADPTLERLRLSSYDVLVRPHCREFLARCYGAGDVGFFSSTTQRNGAEILAALLTKRQLRGAKFFWYRDRTHFDPDSRGHSTVKLVADVLTNPVVNEGRRYSLENVTLYDDSPRKTRFNDPRNVVIVGEFDGDPADEVLRWL